MAKEKNAQNYLRPPVVTVMGHIDHGKTSLLDRIRQTNIASREAGGITQNIGAYQIEYPLKDKSKRKITFIDTPGHAAFSQMRARGAQVTDIVVLVVAADDGVQVQTKECLDHIKNAQVPFLVAINKIDLATASIDKVKGELVEAGVAPEDYGGDVVTIPLSAKTGQGVDDLLEMILLMTDLKDLKADLNADFEGVVIESLMDKQIGPTATVLVNQGILKPGMEIFAETTPAKVRGMINEKNQKVTQALPGDPIRIIGFSAVPSVGNKVTTIKMSSEAEEKKVNPSAPENEEEKQTLNAIFKADTQGVLEAILNSLPSEVNVISKSVGEITDTDVFLAKAGKAEIFAFNVKVSLGAKKLAEQEGVKIRNYKIIYDLLEELEKIILKMMEPTIDEKTYGKAEVIADLEFNKKRVAGCRVLEGKIVKKEKTHLMRSGKIIANTRISSMKHLKDDIEEAQKGQEFGAIFSPQLDFEIGDMLLSYSDSGSRGDSA